MALAVDLAGARIHAAIEDGGEILDILQQYLADYRNHQNELLGDPGFTHTSPYKKTLFTAWETSIASLKKMEASETGIYPIQSLGLMTFLERANIQDDLFRLASGCIVPTCKQLSIRNVPKWMENLLERKDGQ